MGMRLPCCRHRPQKSAVGSPRHPSSVASTDVGICVRRRHQCRRRRRPPPPPGCAPEGQRMVTPGAKTAAVKISAVN